MFLLYIGLVTWLSLAPSEVFRNFPFSFKHCDKVAHFLLYGVMVAIGRWVLAAYYAFRFAWLWDVAGAITYGVLMEIMQAIWFSHHRSFEWLDIAANSAGALCFWWLSRWILHPSPQKADTTDKEPAQSGPVP